MITIVDMPDAVAAAAAGIALGASGAVTIKTTALLTAAEVDQAAHKSVDYTPPGR